MFLSSNCSDNDDADLDADVEHSSEEAEPTPSFDDLVREHYGVFLMYARKYAGEDWGADIVHDAILSAQLAWDRFVPDPGADDIAHAFRGWLFRIIKNKFVNGVRALSYRREASVDPRSRLLEQRPAGRSSRNACATTDPRDELESSASDEVLEAVARLPPHQREAIEMHYFRGVEVDEMAATFRVARQTVWTRLNRARAELRRQLGGYAGGAYGIGVEKPPAESPAVVVRRRRARVEIVVEGERAA